MVMCLLLFDPKLSKEVLMGRTELRAGIGFTLNLSEIVF